MSDPLSSHLPPGVVQLLEAQDLGADGTFISEETPEFFYTVNHVRIPIKRIYTMPTFKLHTMSTHSRVVRRAHQLTLAKNRQEVAQVCDRGEGYDFEFHRELRQTMVSVLVPTDHEQSKMIIATSRNWMKLGGQTAHTWFIRIRENTWSLTSTPDGPRILKGPAKAAQSRARPEFLKRKLKPRITPVLGDEPEANLILEPLGVSVEHEVDVEVASVLPEPASSRSEILATLQAAECAESNTPRCELCGRSNSSFAQATSLVLQCSSFGLRCYSSRTRN